MVLTITVKPTATDQEFGEKYEGTWFNDIKGYKIIKEDADVYAIEDDGTKRLLAKFRKKVIPLEAVQKGWDSFRNAAAPSRNRGAAAGPIDVKGKYWGKRKPVNIDKWSTQYEQNGSTSKMRVNNNVASGVVGFYEKTPFLGIPCRMTSYTRGQMKNYLNGIPFIEEIDNQFKNLVPDAYAKQYAALKKKKAYQIANTTFSTVTVNLNFRTALHKDAGDYRDGFGNLTVIEWGKYHGSYTLFPRYKVGFDVRTGDFLAMNVHEWHTNSPIEETAEDKEFNNQLPDIRTRDPNVGVAGSDHKYQRLTFVCYFREKLSECEEEKTTEYYKREGFDQQEEMKKAKQTSVATLPLPSITGTFEEAHYAVDNTPAGSAARLAQTRKRTRNELAKTKKNKQK
jgi:hypothetical protein